MALIIVVIVVVVVVVSVVLAAILYVMVGGLIAGPGGGPQTIGISRRDTTTNYVLEIDSTPGPHSLATTTFLMRWPANSTVVVPPGQATLRTLETPSGGVQYLPVAGASQNDLRVSDEIVITKNGSYTGGMQITIADDATVLWTGTL